MKRDCYKELKGVQSQLGFTWHSTYCASVLSSGRDPGSGLGNKHSAHLFDEPLLDLLCGGGNKGGGVPVPFHPTPSLGTFFFCSIFYIVVIYSVVIKVMVSSTDYPDLNPSSAIC